MTGDEFERILTSAVNMHIYNLSGTYYVSLKGIVEIIQSNLHPEDRGKWVFYSENGQIGWRRVEQQS